jgi:hypothetical protein
MPVSYREAPQTLPIKTKIAMLGDRYNGVSEALSGWNQSGVPLVGRVDGRWEAVPCGDDTGLFYLVPLLARGAGWNADQSLNVFLLGVLIVAATTGLIGLWLTSFAVWQRVLAFIPIAAGTYVSFRMGDVYVVEASVALMVIPWLLYVLETRVKSWPRFLIIFLCGVVLGIGQWVRTQSASPVLVFFTVLVCFSLLRHSTRILMLITLLVGMSLPLLYAQLPLHERDRFLSLHQPGYRPPLSHHLLWHTAYVGLGFLTNPYVSAWRDSVAVDYVQSVDPATIYGADVYEAILRVRVGEIVRRDYRFIFYTIAAKAGVLACMLLICTNIALVATIRHPKPPGVEMAFWLAMVFAALPGILAIPVPQYVLGMIVLALYYWYYSITFRFAHRQQSAL